MLENPERVLEAEAGDAEAVVEQREQEVEEHGEEDRGPVDDGLKGNRTLLGKVPSYISWHPEFV